MQLLFNINCWLLLLYIYLAVVFICFFYGLATKNVSQVDRLWSILPIFMVWIYAYISEWVDIVIVMACCVTFWGVRLTGNFYIKGGYRMKKGIFVEEDWRWGYLRTFITNPILWQLFHFGFICSIQLALVIGFTIPVLLVALSERSSGLYLSDFLFCFLFLFFLGIETIVDLIMFRFQTEKHSLSSEEQKSSHNTCIRAGFDFSGLRKYSRHPNYFAEVMQWIVIYMWGSYRIGNWLNWGLLFAIALFVVVFCSTFISEPVASKKYPLYAEYQKTTWRFIPFFPVHFDAFVEKAKSWN